MPRIAVISDIHGNVPALEAVIADLEREAPDEILVGGDLVGRGPQGNAVVHRIAELGWRSIRGNHEDYMLDFREGRVPADWLQTDEWSASRWMAAELDDFAVGYISALPERLNAALAGDLLLVHGSPRSANEGLGPWCRDEELEPHVAGVEEGLLVCAHTHRPLMRRYASGLLVNVGAVGLPFNGDRRAQYAIFEPGTDGWSIERRKVRYPVEETLRIYETSGFLAAGGVTAHLLRMELEHAAPYLVPFLRWASMRQVSPDIECIDPFLDDYDPVAHERWFTARARGASEEAAP